MDCLSHFHIKSQKCLKRCLGSFVKDEAYQITKISSDEWFLKLIELRTEYPEVNSQIIAKMRELFEADVETKIASLKDLFKSCANDKYNKEIENNAGFIPRCSYIDKKGKIKFDLLYKILVKTVLPDSPKSLRQYLYRDLSKLNYQQLRELFLTPAVYKPSNNDPIFAAFHEMLILFNPTKNP